MATAPTVTPTPQMNIVKPALQPWERIAWSKAQEQHLYRDAGIFFSYQQQPDLAAQYYNKSLHIRGDDPNALYFRSICKREIAKCDIALKDALLAAVLEPHNPRNRKAIADAYYSCNEFEQFKIESHESTHKFCGSVITEFLNRIIVADENFKDTLGSSLSLFLRKNEALIAEISKKIQESKFPDTRPLWKILQAEHKCDILSILEQKPILLSPREIARRERSLKVFNQIYLGQGWTDVMFMRTLRKEKRWCTAQFRETAPLLCDLAATKYGVVKKFIRMLHARSPMYNEWVHKYPNRKLYNLHHEAYLNHVQNRTRREMFIALRKIKYFRKTGPLVAFAQYVEHVMGEIVVLKTQRVMPWKFEFMNEVYNIFALTLADRFQLQRKLSHKEIQENQLFKLLHINIEPKDRAANFEFGNRATCLAFIENDKFSVYKRFIARLEKRMLFAEHSIEKCYLLHGMAAAHFLQSRFDECCELAKKVIDESRHCNGCLWAFLCSMLIARSHAALYKIERCKDALLEAYGWATILKNDRLMNFVDTVLSINEVYIDMKKKSRSMETLRRRRLSVMNLEDSVDDNMTLSRHNLGFSRQNSGLSTHNLDLSRHNLDEVFE